MILDAYTIYAIRANIDIAILVILGMIIPVVFGVKLREEAERGAK